MAVTADFEWIYREQYASLVRLAWALTGDRDTAEELVQEAFLRAHQRWHRVGAYDRPAAWVRRVVLNLATSRRRRVASEARALGRLGRRLPPEATLAGESGEFWSAVRALPRRQAQVVALHYADDLSVAAVADVLNIAEGTVRATLHQARQVLARRLGDEREQERP